MNEGEGDDKKDGSRVMHFIGGTDWLQVELS